MSGKSVNWLTRAPQFKNKTQKAAGYKPISHRPRGVPKKDPAPAKRHKDYLTREEYIELVNAYQDCKNQHRRNIIAQRIIIGLEHMNRKISTAMAKKWPGSEVDEIMQSGRLGILRALDKWDRKKSDATGAGFLTYVHYWIFAEARRALMRENRGPIAITHNGPPAGKEDDPLYQPPTGYIAFSEPYKAEDPEGVTAGDYLCFKGGVFSVNDGPEEVAAHELSTLLRKVSKEVLTELEHSVLWRLVDGETLEVIGKSNGVSRQRIQQVHAKALMKLRRRLKDTRLETTNVFLS